MDIKVIHDIKNERFVANIEGDEAYAAYSLHDDIAGAGNSGIRSIWLNRKQLKNSTGIRADYEIASLSELLV